jgi:ribosomal peptide maturation radical SAM protein 1
VSAGYEVAARLRDADVLLVVPPFAWQDRPALGVHLLQGIARQVGLETQVLYTNVLFAAWFGEALHTMLTRLQYGLFLGERVFARAAFGGPALGRDNGAALASRFEALRQTAERSGTQLELDVEQLRAIEREIPAWLDSFLPAIAARGHRVVGCSTSFEQTSASLAILHGIKRARPEALAILGGANCEGEMAEGVCSLTDVVDHVFSGESEVTFRSFLEGLERGERPETRIVVGAPCTDLDALPTPDYADYYDQLRAWTPQATFATSIQLSYETSRGCWWGQKSHCTFCGLNGQGMASREKTADRVMAELAELLAAHPTRLVQMTDNIMPRAYFRTLLPRLEATFPDVTIMYEQKANLSLADVRRLVAAGIREIQPGIEALSTGLLALMRKGTTAAQNIALLRYARAAGMRLSWNLLVGFPNDERAFYEETLELLPLLAHLQPPHPPCPVVIDRFSPYFDHPERHGIRDVRPFWFYENVLPETAQVAKVAYHFEGSFPSAAHDHPELVRAIAEVVHAWRRSFYRRPAELRVIRHAGGYLLVDSRGLPGTTGEQPLDEEQAIAALVTRPARATTAVTAWALANKVAIERDGKIVALAIAEPGLLAELESRTPTPRPLALVS